MKPIDKAFRKSGFEYNRVYRDGPWCIYRQTKPGTQIERFEVVRLKVLPAETHWQTGKQMEERESYPSAEEWGLRGWTCLNLEAAHRRLGWQSGKASGKKVTGGNQNAS